MEVSWDSAKHQGHTGLQDSDIWRNLWNSLCVPCSHPLTEVEKDEAGGNGEQALETLPRPMTGKSWPKGLWLLSVEETLSHRERQKVPFPL